MAIAMNWVAKLKGNRYISLGLYLTNKGKATKVFASDNFNLVISAKSLKVNLLSIFMITGLEGYYC